jgi:hypothetical protein
MLIYIFHNYICVFHEILHALQANPPHKPTKQCETKSFSRLFCGFKLKHN